MPIAHYQETAQKLYGDRIRVRVCGVCIVEEKILLVSHKAIVGDKDVWLPPGGGIEEGETAEDALRREFLEETGLEIKVGKLLFTKEFIHAPLHAIELYFMITIVSGILTKGLDPEMNTANQLIEDVRWISLKDPDFVDEAFYLGINS